MNLKMDQKSVLLLNCSNLRNIIILLSVLLFMEQVQMYDRA